MVETALDLAIYSIKAVAQMAEHYQTTIGESRKSAVMFSPHKNRVDTGAILNARYFTG